MEHSGGKQRTYVAEEIRRPNIA